MVVYWLLIGSTMKSIQQGRSLGFRFIELAHRWACMHFTHDSGEAI